MDSFVLLYTFYWYFILITVMFVFILCIYLLLDYFIGSSISFIYLFEYIKLGGNVSQSSQWFQFFKKS